MIKFSKQIFISLVLILSARANAAGKFAFISTIQSGKAAVQVNGPRGAEDRHILLLDLRTGTPSELPWPDDVAEDEFIGAILLPNHLYLVGQAMVGDATNANLYELSLANKTWSKRREIPCASFHSIEIDGSQMNVLCTVKPGDDSAAKVKRKVSLSDTAHLRTAFPLLKITSGGYGIALEGSLFDWSAVTVNGPGGKSIKLAADALLKK